MPAERPLDEVAARTSFARFRVASIVEGIALLVLVGIMTMRYVVFGGDARLAYHGIDRIRAGASRLLPEGGRINLTCRVVD